MTAAKPHTPEPWLEITRLKVGAMRFGTVQLTVQDGQIVNVETTERTRLRMEREAATEPRRKAVH
jgi:hypothetical protein